MQKVVGSSPIIRSPSLRSALSRSRDPPDGRECGEPLLPELRRLTRHPARLHATVSQPHRDNPGRALQVPAESPPLTEADSDRFSAIRWRRDELGRATTLKGFAGGLHPAARDRARGTARPGRKDAKVPVRTPSDRRSLSPCDSLRERRRYKAVRLRRHDEPKRRAVQPDRHRAIRRCARGGRRSSELPGYLDHVLLLREGVRGTAMRVAIVEQPVFSPDDLCQPGRGLPEAGMEVGGPDVGRGTPCGQENAGKEREHADDALHHTAIRRQRAHLSHLGRAGTGGGFSVASAGVVRACPA
jgi:hypothetical protein